MSLSQMAVFNKYFMLPTIETLAQRVDALNEASRGALRLTTAAYEGDFMQESFFKSLSAARRRVDRYTANVAAPVTDLTQEKRSSVKVAGGFGPVRYEPSQMTWLTEPTTRGIEIASSAFADLLLQDQLNTMLTGLSAAIGNNADCVHDVSATADVGYQALNSSHALFGDHSFGLVATVMTGAHMHKMIGSNIGNAERLFTAGNVRVIDILGQIIVVTDSPALVDGTKSKVLSLRENAAVVSDGRDIISNIETKNGNLRIETTLQVDYSFMLGIDGYSWDEANGGKSPSDADLGTGANWIKVMTENKHTAGVMAIGDSTKAAV